MTTWSEHARHYILTSDFDAALISQTHLGKERLLSAVTGAKKSGWGGTGSAATNTVNNGTSAGVLALVPKRWLSQALKGGAGPAHRWCGREDALPDLPLVIRDNQGQFTADPQSVAEFEIFDSNTSLRPMSGQEIWI